MEKASVYELLKLLLPYKFKILFLILMLLFTAGCNLLLPLISKSIMDDGFIDANQGILVKRVLEMLALVLIISGIDIVKDKIRIGIQANLKFTLSQQSFKHLDRLKLSYFDTKNYGEIYNNLKSDIQNVSMVADNSLFFVFAKIFSIIGGMIGLFILNHKLAFLVILFIPIKYFIAKYFANKNRKITSKYIKAEQEYAKWFGDTVTSIKDIKLFNLYDNKSSEFEKYQKEIIRCDKRVNMIVSYNMGIERVIIQILISILYILGSIQVFSLETSIGSTLAFISYSTYVTAPITAIMNIKHMLSGILPSVERFVAFMNLDEEKVSGKEICEYGIIKFTNVSMAYNDKDKNNTVENMTFSISPSSKTAIIGSNGSGKSTIINILLRLYDYSSGRIDIQGTDIREFNLDTYRGMFSVVSQDVSLFNDTIRNNLCLYKHFSDDDIYSAIKASGLDSFIQENTLEYIVGENGSMLSGGEKQKISFARAILHDRPILILDEATSNTDIYSKKFIHQYLFEKFNHKMMIIITHSDELLKLMDNIVLVQNGKIVCCGRYNDLLNNNQIFNDMISDFDR